MKSVAAYCRTGSALQGDPLAEVQQQAKAIQRYAKGRGVAIGETYMDAGASGITLNRAGLQKLLADCRAGKIGTVLTQDLDRLSRDIGQQIEALGAFLDAGVQVEFTEAGRDQYPLQSALLSALAELHETRREA